MPSRFFLLFFIAASAGCALLPPPPPAKASCPDVITPPELARKKTPWGAIYIQSVHIDSCTPLPLDTAVTLTIKTVVDADYLRPDVTTVPVSLTVSGLDDRNRVLKQKNYVYSVTVFPMSDQGSVYYPVRFVVPKQQNFGALSRIYVGLSKK
jgi:hypothetical protein